MNSSGVCFGTSGARGLVSALSPHLCFAYTLAFLQVVNARSNSRLAIAMDLRPSSADIVSACAAAAKYIGVEIDFCGTLPTPALAYYSQMQKIPGIMVTGSHIPFDRNGIKFYGHQGEITKADESAIASAIVAMPNKLPALSLPEVNPVAEQFYVDRYLDFFPNQYLAGMRIGFYEHSSVARDLLSQLLESLGAKVISLGRTDVFVPIDTEAVSQEDIDQAKSWAEKVGFDAIISTDGDADRPLIGDEQGNWFRGDIVSLLCAQYLGAQAVATPVSCNTAIELCEYFPLVMRTRIGSPHVIKAMKHMLAQKERYVVGFEANGGFLLGSMIHKNGHQLAPLMTRDAVLPILALLAIVKEKNCPLSALLRGLPSRFTSSNRLQDFSMQASQQLLGNLSASSETVSKLLTSLGSRPMHIDQTDGIRIFLENGEIVHYRPSGNAPELRCYAEADSQERANWLVGECLRVVRSMS